MYGKSYKSEQQCAGIEYPVEQKPIGGGRTVLSGETGFQQSGLYGGCQSTGFETSLWEQPEIISELVKLPRVLPFYAKTRQGLEQIMQHVEENPSDLTIHCLLNAHSTYTPKVYPYRGFTLVNGEKKMRQIEQIEQLEQRPVWFMFSGMGIEQLQGGMLKEMMKLDSFRRSILRSCEILRPYGINFLQSINGNQQRPITTGIESFVYLTAVQIALADCLRQIGIRPEGLIGQSIGELVCAYVDQCLTHEQALMTSYYLAKCIQQGKYLPKSLMAVVGDLTWEQLKPRCPVGVVPVCFDSDDQLMITGPVQQVKELLRQLRLEGVFVKEIELPEQTSTFGVENYGLIHSQYMNEIVPVLRQYLECLNIVPKQRSSRWISTSTPEQKPTMGKYMSVEYLLNLLTSPVMLQQTLRQVPKNAIVIEISPKSMVQHFLKKQTSFGGAYPYAGLQTIVSLMPTLPKTTYGTHELPKVLEHFMIQLGKLYIEGVDFDSIKLFVPVHLERTVYPVPVQKSLIDLFSQWNFKPETLSVFVKQQPKYAEDCSIMNGMSGLTISGSDIETYKFTVDVESLLEKESYLLNHQINGRVLYPTSGYLYLVWKSLAQLHKQQQRTTGIFAGLPIHLDSIFGLSSEFEQLPPVWFENVQIHRATVLREQPQQVVIVPQNRRVLFQINIQPSTGLFEIVEGRNVIVNGRVYIPTGWELNEFVTPFKPQWESEVRCNLVMPQEEIYKQFRQCGYEYNGEFQSIVRTNLSGTQGELLWTGKWIPFLDAMLQMNVLAQQLNGQQQSTFTSTTTTGVVLPTRIRSVKINPLEHSIRGERFVTLPVFHDLYTNKTLCGSIEITGLQVTPVILPREQIQPTVYGETFFTGDFTPSTTITLTVTGTQPQPTTISTPFFGTGKYTASESEQIPVPFGQQWYKGYGAGIEQPVYGKTGQQWTFEGEKQQRQGEWTIFDSKVEQPTTICTIGGEQQKIGLFNPRLTHVIVGALDCEFGMELAQWMVQFGGARYLVLTTSKAYSGAVAYEPTLTVQQIQKMRYLQNEFGCQIKIVSTLDLSDETECLLLIKQACRMTSHYEGKIGSVFHLGGLVVEQQPTSFLTNGSLSIKSLYHLDKYTRCSTIMPDTGLFVAFTKSIPSGFSTVQTGLKSIIEEVCESRRRESGRHCLVVDWTVLFNFTEFRQPTGYQYEQALIRLEQILTKSIRFQFPVEYQQMPTIGEQYQNGEYPFYQQLEQPEIVLRQRRPIVTGCQDTDMMFYTPSQRKRQLFAVPQKTVEKLNNVEFVYGQQPLFVVLPIDVQVGMIKSWAQQVKVPVYGLFYSPECMRYETVEQLGQFYWQQIEKLFPQFEKVHLVGHTYGVPVAFEMASRRSQQVMSLVLMDSGLTQSFLNTGLVGYGRESMSAVSEFEALYKFYQQFVLPSSRIAYEQFVQVLSQMPTFDERVKYVVGKIVEQSKTFVADRTDLAELEQAARLFVQQMIMTCKYVPTQPLRLTKILVIRPTTMTSVVPTQRCNYGYGQQPEMMEQELIEKIFQGMKQFVMGKLQVHLVDVDQKSFFQGENVSRIASIMNQQLVREF